MWVSRSIAKRLMVHPEAADSGVRAWLTYVALTVAAVIALGDTVYFVAAFLHGDITVRLVLKTAVILLITGGIISYYISAMRGAALSPVRDRAYATAAILSVMAGLGFGFFDTGSPQYQHSVALDERRISDLNSLRIQLNDAKPLPRSLDGLPSLQYSGSSRTDPTTNRPYEYTRTGKKSFTLCATFDTADNSRTDGFNHPAGRACFKS